MAKSARAALVGAALTLGACGPQALAPADAAPRDLGRPPADDLIAPSGPTLLSETGLYGDFASRTLAPGVIVYEPRYPVWSDGGGETRYLQLPSGTQIDTSDLDDWVFPVGTKLWKEFRSNGVRVETRFLSKQPAGWWWSAYVWRGDDSDADATVDGVADARGTTHDVPSQSDCYNCHVFVRDAVIGVSAYQLSSPGGDGALTLFANLGLLSNPPAHELSPPGAGVVQDAIGYLHGNCGHCHNRTATVMNLRKLNLRLAVAEAGGDPTQTGAYLTTIGSRTFHDVGDTDFVVVRGQPDASQLYYRMTVRSLDQMPPTATEHVDPAGLATIRAWISGL